MIRHFVTATIFCGAAAAAVILLSSYNNILFVILLGILSTILLYDQSINPVILISSGAIGAITESIIMTYAQSSWSYVKPDIYNLPIWLIPLWSVAGYGVHSLYKIKF